MSELSDVYVEYTFTIKALGQVHRAVVEVPGAKIAEFRQRENDQESHSFDIAHSLSEEFVGMRCYPFSHRTLPTHSVTIT